MNNGYDRVATNADGETKGFVETMKQNVDAIDVEHDTTLQLFHEPDDEVQTHDESLLEEIFIPSRMFHILHRTLLSDDEIHFRNMRLFDGPSVVKFLKFLAASSILIVILFHLIRYMEWEYNGHLKLLDLYTYESNLMIQDALVYFVVGRLYKQRGIDHLAWILWCLAANVFSSVITRFRFLQHAFTLYEIHCRWPWQLWVYISLVTPLVVVLILRHVHLAVQQRIFLMKLGELLLSLCLFLVPYIHSDYLHIHHWYMGWLLGMHLNFDTWWSRAGMAWCWGLYLNGISAYGRDPVLTCGYTYWLSEHMRCPYLRCYQEEIEHPTPRNSSHHVEPMVTPDWRNCSADTYHP